MTGRLMKTILEHLNKAPELEREVQIVRAVKGEPITNKTRVTIHISLKRLIKRGYVDVHYEPQPYYEINKAGAKQLMKSTQKS